MSAVNATGTDHRSEELAFRFVAGNRALDLLSTLGNRHRQPIERLCSPSDLDRWLVAAGLHGLPRAQPHDLQDAHAVREAINRLTRAILADASLGRADLHDLNEWARRTALAPQIGPRLDRRWFAPERSVQAALALLAREAVELLTGPERHLIRECAATPRCSLLYLDRSRAQRRRWCEMGTCGSRAKMSSYRRRRSEPA